MFFFCLISLRCCLCGYICGSLCVCLGVSSFCYCWKPIERRWPSTYNHRLSWTHSSLLRISRSGIIRRWMVKRQKALSSMSWLPLDNSSSYNLINIIQLANKLTVSYLLWISRRSMSLNRFLSISIKRFCSACLCFSTRSRSSFWEKISFRRISSCFLTDASLPRPKRVANHLHMIF